MVAAVIAALGLSAAVTWAALGDGPIRRPVQVTPTTEGPAPTTAPTATPDLAPNAGPPLARPPSEDQASPSPAASPEGTRLPSRLLRASGAVDPRSIDNWAQSNVTLSNSKTVTALRVRVRIARTPHLSSTGSWSSVPVEYLDTTVEEQPDALVYTFSLKPGARLGPGEYVFAVQYGHAVGGRNPVQDTYQAIATADGTVVEVEGGF
jgi:hypothetical protein